MQQKPDLDALYQQAVDEQAHGLLSQTATDIINFPDYGSFSIQIAGRAVIGGFWHHRFEANLHHIYFQLHRQVWLTIYKKYLSGIKLNSAGLKANYLTRK